MSQTNAAMARLEDEPTYATEQARLRELEAERQRLAVEEARLANQASGHSSRAISELDRAASRLLDGNAGQSPTEGERFASLEKVRDDLRVVERAIDLQRRKLADEFAPQASHAVAKSQLANFRSLVKRMSVALANLGAVIVEEQQFRDRLADGGVSFAGVIHPMAFLPREVTIEAIGEWQREAQTYYPGVT